MPESSSPRAATSTWIDLPSVAIDSRLYAASEGLCSAVSTSADEDAVA